MRLISTELPGVIIVEPAVFTDVRGSFFESFRADVLHEAGLPDRFVQGNHSCSRPGTIRGLHYQLERPQGKLIRIVRGAVCDVAVDIRRGSPTFGRWIAVELSAANRRQLYIPPGFAHGFSVPDVESEMEYKCTDYYAPDDQRGIRWDDPTLAIDWGVAEPVLSEKDRAYELLTPSRADLPRYEPEK